MVRIDVDAETDDGRVGAGRCEASVDGELRVVRARCEKYGEDEDEDVDADVDADADAADDGAPIVVSGWDDEPLVEVRQCGAASCECSRGGIGIGLGIVNRPSAIIEPDEGISVAPEVIATPTALDWASSCVWIWGRTSRPFPLLLPALGGVAPREAGRPMLTGSGLSTMRALKAETPLRTAVLPTLGLARRFPVAGPTPPPASLSSVGSRDRAGRARPTTFWFWLVFALSAAAALARACCFRLREVDVDGDGLGDGDRVKGEWGGDKGVREEEDAGRGGGVDWNEACRSNGSVGRRARVATRSRGEVWHTASRERGARGDELNGGSAYSNVPLLPAGGESGKGGYSNDGSDGNSARIVCTPASLVAVVHVETAAFLRRGEALGDSECAVGLGGGARFWFWFWFWFAFPFLPLPE